MEKFSWTTVFYFRFYILWENFSKIGPIIKKIPKFSDDPLKGTESAKNQQNIQNWYYYLIWIFDVSATIWNKQKQNRPIFKLGLLELEI